MSRPGIKRGSPLSTPAILRPPTTSRTRPASVEDSSDDDLPVPLKFSALAEAILRGEAAREEVPSPGQHRPEEKDMDAIYNLLRRPRPTENRADSALGTSQGSSHPVTTYPSPPPARVVRLSSSPRGSGSPRSKAAASKGTSAKSQPEPIHHSKASQLQTPGSGQRATRVKRDPVAPRYTTASPEAPRSDAHRSAGTDRGSRRVPTTADRHNSSGSRHYDEGNVRHARSGSKEVERKEDRPDEAVNGDGMIRQAPLTVGRSRQPDEMAGHRSTQPKRINKVSGSFLSGPARRGKRRQSEEDHSPEVEHPRSATASSDAPKSSHLPKAPDSGRAAPAKEAYPIHGTVPVRTLSEERAQDEGIEVAEGSPKPHVPIWQSGHLSGPPKDDPLFKPVQQAPVAIVKAHEERENVYVVPKEAARYKHFATGSPSHNKENRRPTMGSLLDQVEPPLGKKAPQPTPMTASPERRVLATRDQNTPRRPAPPPPPKMTVLDTATTRAGAATAQTRKKRMNVTVNGKNFTRMDCIGRGGSSRVYRVMADNYKIFALKKVALEDIDASTLRGYKGEIDLLKKLNKVDRVVSLFDFEMNEEKQTLNVLMEIGESDLDRVLHVHQNNDNPQLDLSHTRFIWKEMLECVRAVHLHDIVHSDLKPANFLLVQGRLKLIDFGIANTIQDDTVNVHRENQIGTPNYMAPEAIVDCNAQSGLPATAGRMMKLGKPSDVWSLGCILYKMVYGKPPFAHITNQVQRIMAIPNPDVKIHYPATGVGGVSVPAGLLRTLRSCLDRNQHRRPTVASLLDPSDPFLYPDAVLPADEFLISRLIHSVVNNCRANGVPADAEVQQWPAQYFGRLKAVVAGEAVRL
ncbi:MAG: Dual-specificity kinase, spindle pole body (SPB) duplication and spindle checkpoint function [Caeruleum heppii]|nr:MAG: Dual-specificity kinase, spindle pole body (SPB) duplication and spindle checkpoint function [Caeruleum heppii]